MTQTSCISIENRSVESFKKIIKRLIGNSYNNICSELQGRMQKFYQGLLVDKHTGQILKYVISNEYGHWCEKVSLSDEGHGHLSLSIMLDNCIVDLSRKTEYQPKPLPLIISELKTYLLDKEYCSVLLKRSIFDFISECCVYLNNTHVFELNVENEILCVKAIPLTDGGSHLSIVSRSDNAVIAKDSENLQQLKELGYHAEIDDMYNTTWH
jgi:hypothetical protein